MARDLITNLSLFYTEKVHAQHYLVTLDLKLSTAIKIFFIHFIDFSIKVIKFLIILL